MPRRTRWGARISACCRACQDDYGATRDVDRFTRCELAQSLSGIGRRVENWVPAHAKPLGGHREWQALMVRVEEQENTIATNRLAIVVDIAERIAVQEYAK